MNWYGFWWPKIMTSHRYMAIHVLACINFYQVKRSFGPQPNHWCRCYCSLLQFFLNAAIILSQVAKVNHFINRRSCQTRYYEDHFHHFTAIWGLLVLQFFLIFHHWMGQARGHRWPSERIINPEEHRKIITSTWPPLGTMAEILSLLCQDLRTPRGPDYPGQSHLEPLPPANFTH